MVFQVLLRLPVRSLLRFRSVSKSWRATVSSPYFARRHAELSKSAPSMLILPRQRLLPPQRMRGIGFFQYPGHGDAAELVHEAFWSTGVVPWLCPMHCDGLVVVPGYESQVFVCNPATRELVLLPRGVPDYIGYQKVGFGFDASTGTYKVVRCYFRYYDSTVTSASIECEVFTLGSCSWRPAADPPCAIKAQTPVCLLGAIYWPSIVSDHEVGIVRFGLANEEFAVFPSPPCMYPDAWDDSLTGLSGKLCYGRHFAAATFELRMAEDYGSVRRPEWSLCYKFALLQRCYDVSPFAAHDGSIFLSLDGSLICRYDTRTGTQERVVDMQRTMAFHHPQHGLRFRIGGWPWSHHVIQYSESLISVKG